MKKIVLLAALLLPTFLFAQHNESHLQRAWVKHGTIMIGGNTHASYQSYTNTLNGIQREEKGRIINAVLNAKTGYFVMHDFAVGLDLTINHESRAIESEQKRDPIRRTFALGGPFARYYLTNGIFGEISAAYGLHNFSTGDKNNLLQGAVGVGYAYFVNERFSIEPILSVRYFREANGDLKYTSITPMLGVGIQAYLLRKRSHIIKQAL